MESRKLNRIVSISTPEKEALIKQLVASGIDKDLASSAINSAADGCTKADNCQNKCKSYYKVGGPDIMSQLKNEMIAKKIDIKKLGPAASKLFG